MPMQWPPTWPKRSRMRRQASSPGCRRPTKSSPSSTARLLKSCKPPVPNSTNGASGLRGGLGLDLLGLVRRRGDRDLARLQLLGDVALEVDEEQAVLQRGAFDLDMVGELEAALKGPRGNAAIEQLGIPAVVLFLALAL